MVAGGLFMSISFTQYNVANLTDIIIAGRNLTSDLFDLGFNATNSIVSVSYDPGDNSFVDQADLHIAPIELMNASPSLELLKRQAGFGVNYFNSQLETSLSVRFVNHNATSICMLEIGDRDFYRFFKTDNIQFFVNILCVSGKCINAIAGFGAMETEWEPHSENAVVRFIIDGPPEYEGKQPPAGLIKNAYLTSNRSLAEEIRKYFDLFEKNGYSVLIRKGATQLFSSI